MLMSMAVIQDGIGFPFFAPCAYEYLCGKAATEIRPEISDIPDEDFRTLALQVRLDTAYDSYLFNVHSLASASSNNFISGISSN